MRSRPSSRIWLVAGASLGVSGGFVILISLPEGGVLLWLGLGLVASGSLVLRVGLAGLQHERGTKDNSGAAESVLHSDSSIEPELLQPLPRKVKMTRRGKLIVTVWVLTLTVFGALALQHFGRLPPPSIKRQLEQHGALASAVVHGREVRKLPNDRSLYFIAYNFETEAGAPVRINRSVPPRVFALLAEGDTTRVVYFPDDPHVHYLPEITSPVSTRLVFVTAGLLLAAAGFTEAQRRLHRRLVSTGAPVSGFVANVRRRGGVRSFLVNYNVAGERRTLKAAERNSNLRNGQLATVLHETAISGRAVLYRLALYRART